MVVGGGGGDGSGHNYVTGLLFAEGKKYSQTKDVKAT